MNQLKRKVERTAELVALRPLTVYPKLPLSTGEHVPNKKEKQGRSLMARNVLESKVNQLQELIEDFETSIPFDEEIEWCLNGLKDYAKSLHEIVEDYHHFSERAA